MARWKLLTAHYLQVPGSQWEYKEVDRTTGRPKRVTFDVPQLLDPTISSDWNYKHNQDEGEIIVCKDGKGEPRDIVFLGDPTPDMLPLDDEARAISASFAMKWKHPIDTLSSSYGDHLLAQFQAEVAKAQSVTAQPQVEGMSELLTVMTAMMKQNQEILATLVAKPKTEAPALRRA